FIQLNNIAGINAGNATVVRGNESDDRIFVRGVSSAEGTTTRLEGNAGADRFYASSNANKSLFMNGAFYDDDDAPLDRLSGDLPHLGGLVIDTGPAGNQGTRDGIFLSADASSTGVTGTLGLGTVSGFGMEGAITYTAENGAALRIELSEH